VPGTTSVDYLRVRLTQWCRMRDGLRVSLPFSYDLVMSWDTALTTRIVGPLFARPEPRASFADLVRGLLAADTYRWIAEMTSASGTNWALGVEARSRAGDGR
jgi:hypothetical protein